MGIIDLVPFAVAFFSLVVTAYKLYKVTKVDEFFFSALTSKVPKLEKYMLIPRVASLAIKFSTFVRDDLSDGQLDNLALFDSFLLAIKKDKPKLENFLKTF